MHVHCLTNSFVSLSLYCQKKNDRNLSVNQKILSLSYASNICQMHYSASNMILLLLKSLIHLKDWLKKRKLKRIFKQVSNQFTFKLFLSFESSSFKAFTSNNSDIRDFSFSACFFIFSQRADISSSLVWLRTWREKVIYIQIHAYFI